MMRKFASLFVVAVCASVWFTMASCAQTGAPPEETLQKSDNAQGKSLKPEELLRQMADYLGNLPAFSCRLESTIEIKADGKGNKMVTKMTARLERPNRLALLVDEGVMGITIVSDGKQLFLFYPMLKRYMVKDAPADFAGIRNAIGELNSGMMGISGALIPVDGKEFYRALTDGVIKSEYVGDEKVGDVLCHRLRFERNDFNWDIWIEAGDKPLVHKVVPDLSKQFANLNVDTERPQLDYSVVLSDWNVEPKFTDADFAFEPPADAQKVESLFEGLRGGREEGPHPLLGQPAPPFETVDVDEKPIDLKQHLGKDIVMLDFWATWCGPCIQAMPQVQAVADKFADKGLVFYAVNVGEDAETIKEFLKTSELAVPVAMDATSEIAGLYQAEGIPQTVLIGKDGKVQVVHVGFSENLGDILSKEIEDLVAGKDLAAEALAEAEKSQETSADDASAEEPSETQPTSEAAPAEDAAQ